MIAAWDSWRMTPKIPETLDAKIEQLVREHLRAQTHGALFALVSALVLAAFEAAGAGARGPRCSSSPHVRAVPSFASRSAFKSLSSAGAFSMIQSVRATECFTFEYSTVSPETCWKSAASNRGAWVSTNGVCAFAGGQNFGVAQFALSHPSTTVGFTGGFDWRALVNTVAIAAGFRR